MPSNSSNIKASAATRNRAKEAVEKAQKARGNTLLYDFLDWKYRERILGNGYLLEVCGERYPVAVYPLDDITQSSNIDSILSPLAAERPLNSTETQASKTFRHTLMLADRFRDPEINRLTYSLESASTEGRLLLRCYQGDYFASFDTSDVLEWELLQNADKLLESTEESFRSFDSLLQSRNRLHSLVKDPLLDGSSRTAGIAISTLIVFRSPNGNSYNALVRKRTQNAVAAHPGGYHVIPSFMFQATSENFATSDYSIVKNIKREYLEELFDKDEFTDTETDVDGTRFLNDPRMKTLTNLLKNGDAELFLTGFVVNLMTMRPEVCTLLVIHSNAWFNNHTNNKNAFINFKFNLETLSRDIPLAMTGAGLGTVAIHRDNREMMRASLSRASMVPSGAAAFWLGIEKAREVTLYEQS